MGNRSTVFPYAEDTRLHARLREIVLKMVVLR